MKRIMKVLTCFTLLLLCMSMPVFAKSNITQSTQKTFKINKSGYAQKKLTVKALPGKKGKTVGKIKINTDVKYKKVTKNWSMTIYNGRIGFVQTKYLKASQYTPSYFKRMGVIGYQNRRWTWYSQRVLPGGGLRIPGRHVDERGFVCDKNNYICLASNNVRYGAVIDTPFGKCGKIYDSGCSGIDVYVNW